MDDSFSNNFLDPNLNELFNFMQLYHLNQFNTIPNGNNKYLDLILSNINFCNILVNHSVRPLVSEDNYHPALSIVIQFVPVRVGKRNNSVNIDKYDFKKADYLTMWNLFSFIDWNFLNNYDDVNTAVYNFYGHIYNVLDQTVPLRTFNKKFPSWYSTDTINLIKCKSKIRKFALNSGDLNILANFKYLRSQLKKSIARDYDFYLQNIENNLISDPKKFWSYFKKNNSLPNNIFYNNMSYNNDNDIANVFADYFSSVYKSSSVYDRSSTIFDSSSFDLIKIDHITFDDVMSAIKKLKSSLSVGVDKIPSFIVKGCADGLIYPLLILFNLSLNTKTFPDAWKQTKIIPILKKGIVNDCKNYRPIAILSPFSKIFEIIVYNKLFLQVKGLISSAQHGFMPKRSTLTNLFCLNNKIISSFEKGYQLDVIYTDFSKAFDSIDFGILLGKLIGMGFHINLADWIFSYLCNRMLYVYFNGAISNSFTNTSGVPQGSNLGPLLFILFINDLCEILKFSEYLLFADDLKLFKQICSVVDSDLLQNDLDSLFLWCNNNNLFLNIQKCSILSYSRKSHNINYCYQINNLPLSRSDSVLDLGVTFDAKLDFSFHINSIISKSYKKLGLIKRKTKDFSNQVALKTLFFSLVRSNLEYCSLIWNPHHKSKIGCLEQVQNRFARYLYYKSNSVYIQDISSSYLRNIFNLPSLKSRRDLFCLLFFYKVINNMIDCSDILSCINIFVPNRTLRNYNLFEIPFVKYNYIGNFSLYKFYKIYNKFSNDLDVFDMPFHIFKGKCCKLLNSH